MQDLLKDTKLNINGTAVECWVSGFPLQLWLEWNKQCQDQHGDIRWIKIWSDHLKAQCFDYLMQNKLAQMKVVREDAKNNDDSEKGASQSLGLLNPDNEYEERG